ncbi:sigma-70 family RNA polymerase sigma factor [Clostridium cellulovorans]|uniref:RNA polymerase, sigma-24 subunit, ECF subfamily n=1 Tax=Clostridium cellulovorans (strain ATCC 35296 / DSM 3052 / OCM 3 / 743B) TaxID=573061 RepID=D9SU17_CLOC7|nr:sigma-70 family RNA polymerase sigma factor [Clostridium cellulovorans]ADL50855.1 RNA polymerase, sigma-24 subunit, ECF subfamily [Clostridium cellulovorans 743B]
MDEEIVALIRKRNEKGIEILINEYAPLIKAIVKKHLYNLGQYHEECINDVYLGVWNNIHSFDKEKNILKNWVAAITKYKTIDYKRKYLKDIQQVDISELNIESNFNLEKEVLQDEIAEETEQLLKTLSPKDKELFIRLFMDEDSVQEISRDLNMKPAVLYNRVSRGKSKLRSLFSRT